MPGLRQAANVVDPDYAPFFIDTDGIVAEEACRLV